MSMNEPPPEQPVPPPSGGYGEAPPPPPPSYGGAPPVGGGSYSATAAWGYGWNKFTGNLGSILIAILVLVAVQIVLQVVSYFVRDTYVLSILIGLVSWIVSMIIGAGIVRGALDITEGRALDPKTLLTPPKLGQVIVASILIGVATFIGLILLLIPGLLVAYFTSFTLYFLMDRPELGAIDAIKASFGFTTSHAGDVIVWFLLSLLTYVVGFCLCGVGLIAAIPVIILGTAYTYKKLTNEPLAA